MKMQYCGKVVLDTTKVQIFKQITTPNSRKFVHVALFQIPQRYRFSSKSQQHIVLVLALHCCFRYHKGTDFQANHNWNLSKQLINLLFQIPQRYRFSSKSQQDDESKTEKNSCFRYHKGTDFQANHNQNNPYYRLQLLFQIPQRYRFSSKSQQEETWCIVLTVVLDTTKVQIFKQITTIA